MNPAIALKWAFIALVAAFLINDTRADVTGPKNIVVLRVYFHDYANASRYSKPDVEGFFAQLATLWGDDNSYGRISLSYQVSDLYQLPSNRTAYIDDFASGDLSNGGKFTLVLTDAIANSPAAIAWTSIDAVMVVMAETDAAQFHRGQGGTCTLKMGPSATAPSKYVGCAIFSENPSESDLQVWGRWAHEIGHAFQEGNPPHPSNYSSEFELMDSNYPGQTGVVEKWLPGGFGGWMPQGKYRVFTKPTGGGTASLYAEEYRPSVKPNFQAIKADITATRYYMVSVRRRVNGDELNGDFQAGAAGTRGIPDEGVLIERVVENGDASVAGSPWVVLQGKGGNRNNLWKDGDTFNDTTDGIWIVVDKKFDDDNYQITVRYSDGNNQPDVGIYPWRSPPGNTYETTDIWVDSPVNGYDVFRYGTWSDLHGGTVPTGNGDDPMIGQVNRLYARVRNFGTLAATNVVVHFDVTDPLGLGIIGSNGFTEIGSVSSAEFPGLASIAPGAYEDVYIEWTPNATLTAAQVQAGRFQFHSCVRVRIDHLPGEQVFSNQDGDGTQENIGYFEATASPGEPMATPYRTVIRLKNDDKAHKKYFYINYRNQLPPKWKVEVNKGVAGIELPPGGSHDIPVVITQTTREPYGKTFFVDVSASSQRILVNDMNPKDTHMEFKELGGVRIAAQSVLKVKVACKAKRTPSGIEVVGKLTGVPHELAKGRLPIMVQGVTDNGQFMTKTGDVAVFRGNEEFRGTLRTSDQHVKRAVCLFAGTDKLSSASSGFVAVQ